MKILFIGGTGNISTAASRELLFQGHELTLLHRNTLRKRADLSDLSKAEEWLLDISDDSAVRNKLHGKRFDAVVDWIAFTPDQVERDLRLFKNHTAQYIFISSASAYQKPPQSQIITERTPLENPYWVYSRNKIACEAVVRNAMAQGFPATIVRPSLTYDMVLPVPFGGWTEWSIVEHLQKGLPVVVPGETPFPWTITHSEDFARGFIPLLGHPQAIGEDFHITSDEHPSWAEIHQWLAEAVGCQARIVQVPVTVILKVAPEFEGTLLGDKAWPAIFDNAKIRRIAPEYKAVIPFREGIRRTVKWFEADKSRQKVSDGSLEILRSLSALVHP